MRVTIGFAAGGAVAATALLLGADHAGVIRLRQPPPPAAAPSHFPSPPRDPAALPLPPGPPGELAAYGRRLVSETYALIGPEVADPAMRFAGNNLACSDCHGRAGLQRFDLPFVGIEWDYPQYSARTGRADSIEDRINECMTRSMNGRDLPPGGRELQAIAAWIRFLGQGVPAADAATGRGVPPLPSLGRAADPRRGERVYELRCIGCHQADGQGARRGAAGDATGYHFPPLWGPDSYNDGAGMARLGTFAAFVHANMPLGATYRDPVLSAEDAWDVAAYVNSQPRPAKAGLEADFPDRWRKPVDAPYGPWADPFPAEQHKYGPWQPIQAWIRMHAPR